MLGDFTGDGRPDIAGWATPNADSLWVIPNTSTPHSPSRGTSMHIPDGWQTVTSLWVADYDGDGEPDLLGLDSTTSLLIWRNVSASGTPAFAPYASLGTGWNNFVAVLSTK